MRTLTPFYRWVDAVRLKLGLAMIGACFEVAPASSVRGRVHAHAFLSVDIGDSLWAADGTFECRPFVAADFEYQRCRVHLQPLLIAGRRRTKRFVAAVGIGMYYVLARKEGQLRSRGNKAVEEIPRECSSSIFLFGVEVSIMSDCCTCRRHV